MPFTNRRQFLKHTGLALTSISLTAWTRNMDSSERPNFLWLVSEDNSPFLGCYGDSNARTSHIDQLAADGVLYENAFANAPVCAPARCTLITGMYANSLGAQHMRSRNAIPSDIRFFTNYLREAGYYCSNNDKEDYNIASKPAGCWDESGKNATYKKRKPGQPFFAVFNHSVSHESSLHEKKPLKHDPAGMKLRAYHPDKPEIRRDYAQYYDQISKLDEQIGLRLAELKAEGLSDNTIVFYYSDHGGVLTRSKRFLYDSGTHVPLIIRFPEKYRHLAPGPPGSRENRLVSFVDFAPTVLSLAGIRIPDIMQGHAFLGAQADKPRSNVYFFRDRMDERYDMMRAVRNKGFLYIRNYYPHLVYGQHLDYLWRMETTRVWEQCYQNGQCKGPETFFWETKPVEELYKIIDDPDQIHNLAGHPQYAQILHQMQDDLQSWMMDIRDTGFLPEPDMIKKAGEDTIYERCRDNKRYKLDHIMTRCHTAIKGDAGNLTDLKNMLHDEDSGVRYWGSVGCRILGDSARPLFADLETLLSDSSPSVRIAAAESLIRYKKNRKALNTLGDLLFDENTEVRLMAANIIDHLDQLALPLLEQMKRSLNDRNWMICRVMEKALGDLDIKNEPPSN